MSVKFIVRELYGEQGYISADLEDITSVHPEDGIIYIDGNPCDLDTAEPITKSPEDV